MYIIQIITQLIWMLYLYKNIFVSMFYFSYYDFDNKLFKLLLLGIYHFSSEMITFLFLLEYITTFINMEHVKVFNLYKIRYFIKILEYNLLLQVIYPYYGIFMLNISSKILEVLMIVLSFSLYKQLNKIAYIQIYSKYKKIHNNVKRYSKKNIDVRYFQDYIKEEISEYFKIKRMIGKNLVFMCCLYIIFYNTFVYTLYLYYTSLIVFNYNILDKMLFKQTKIKENEKSLQIKN